MIEAEQVYFLTFLGKSELAAAETSLSPAELELLVLIDGKARVRQVQASAEKLAPDKVLMVMDRLLRSERIALQLIELDDHAGDSIRLGKTGELPNASAIERGVSSLRQNGYVVRIARRPPPESRSALNDKHEVMAALNRRLMVLVVEDDRSLAENVRTVLDHAGFAVRIASNRDQLIEAFRQSPTADLVLLDVMLPDANGFAVLADMRRHPSLEKVPAIMVTSAATRESVLKGLQEGADGYITKPFEISVLLKAVKTVLGLEPAGAYAGHDVLWEDDS